MLVVVKSKIDEFSVGSISIKKKCQVSIMAERYLANSSSDGIIPSGGGGSFKSCRMVGVVCVSTSN